MDTKAASQSKSKLASKHSKTGKDNVLSAQNPKRTKRYTKRTNKLLTKQTVVPVSLFVDKLKRHKHIYYSFEITYNLSLLPKKDIVFLLNIQNSLPTKDWIFVKKNRKI